MTRPTTVGGALALALACQSPLAGQERAARAPEALTQIHQEFERVHRAWIADLSRGEPIAAAPSKPFVDRCLRAAKTVQGTADAVPYLVWILQHGVDEKASMQQALTAMVENHADSAAWADVIDVLLALEPIVGEKAVAVALATIIDRTPNAEVEARARFVRGIRALRNRESDDRHAGHRDLTAAFDRSADPELRGRAEAFRAPVPEPLVIIDDHDKARRMAAREGKLLLLTFSGFNCASCRVMEQHVLGQSTIRERLAERFIESRLHVDTRSTLTEATFARNREVRARYGNKLAIPTYFVVDPRTGRPLRHHELTGGPGGWTKDFLAFVSR